MKIGYFKHWTQPPYSFIDFLREELGLEITLIDYKKPGYLEGLDVVLIEQNGFNDFIENDELYFRDFIRRGGICWFMHQDYRRWAKYFLPEEIGYPYLVHRYVTTIEVSGVTYKCYMLPGIEDQGRRLFQEPNVINPEDMFYWKVRANSFGLVGSETGKTETVKSAALSCAVDFDKWEVLASYMDPVISKGALVLQARYGEGLYFWNQILFPEEREGNSPKVWDFWRKYVPNVLEHFRRFRRGEDSYAPTPHATLAPKRNYKTAIHLHSCEWYGGDSSLFAIQAMMRSRGYDIATIAIKDAIPYGNHLDLDKYSDDKILLLHGQEYHPFNWTEANHYYGSTHNAYHILSMGNAAYTPEFTRSLFSNEDIRNYLVKAIDFIHANGGAACATHPYFDYWKRYDYDAVDHEPLRTIANTDYDRFYDKGGRIAMMVSVDLFGAERLEDNPAANFIYVQGTPDRDSVVKAIRQGHTIAACWFKSADIGLGDAIPGDTVTLQDILTKPLHISAETEFGPLRSLRIYSAGKLIWQKNLDTPSIDLEVRLPQDLPYERYLRVEIEGVVPPRPASKHSPIIAVSTPFYLNAVESKK